MAKALKAVTTFTRDGITLLNKSNSRNSNADNFDYRVITVSTSETTFTIDSNIGNARECVIVNTDSTNYIDVGFDTTRTDIRLNPGRVALFDIKPTQSALYLIASTASVEVEIMIAED